MKSIRNILLASLVALPLLAQTPATETWTVDKVHSAANFSVRHFVSKVPGQFRNVDGTITLDRANPAKSSVEFTIQTASVDTGNENRDNHLRSPDFFDAAKFPTITFKSTSIVPKSKTEFDVTGDLTMHGVTKRVTLPVSFGGFLRTAKGEKAGFDVTTTIDRKDYGIVWNKALDEGGTLLGDDVKVSVSLELDRKMPAPAVPTPGK